MEKIKSQDFRRRRRFRRHHRALQEPADQGLHHQPDPDAQGGHRRLRGLRPRSCSRSVPTGRFRSRCSPTSSTRWSAQARAIASWGKNVNVKIPVTNTKGEFSGPLISSLSRARRGAQRHGDHDDDQVERVAECHRSRASRQSSRCLRAAWPTPGAIRCRRCRRASRAAQCGRRPSCCGQARASCSTSSRPTRSAATSSP